MKYFITVYYNEQGKKLTKQDSYQFSVDYSYSPTDEHWNDIVYKEVPKDLIFRYSIDDTSVYSSIVVGDYVCVKCTKTERYGSSTWTEMHQVKSIDDEKIVLDDFEYNFQLNGVAITRKKKDVPVLRIPSKQEIESHKELLEKEKLWREIYDFVVAPNGNIDDPYIAPTYPHYITVWDLKEILRILHGDDSNCVY